ncbi:MAG: hypothetical protein RLZZ67_155 [Candidatus Parcubacteria bacterium]
MAHPHSNTQFMSGGYGRSSSSYQAPGQAAAEQRRRDATQQQQVQVQSVIPHRGEYTGTLDRRRIGFLQPAAQETK